MPLNSLKYLKFQDHCPKYLDKFGKYKCTCILFLKWKFEDKMYISGKFLAEMEFCKIGPWALEHSGTLLSRIPGREWIASPGEMVRDVN
jgi:hypothetical protein